MLEKGLIEETEKLLNKGYSPDLKPMKAIGYRHMVKYLRKDWSLQEATHFLQKDTRHYAKRQITWFRADPEYFWSKYDDFDLILNNIRLFINNENN